MSLWNKIKSWFKIETAERLSWGLISYIGGILTCFWLEINIFFLISLIGICCLIFYAFRRHLFLSWGSFIFIFFFLGMSNMNLHVYLNRHFILQNPVYQTPIFATVSENQVLIEKQILTLSEIQWKNPDLKMPPKIKVHFKKSEPFLNVGDKVKAIVSVYPVDEKFSTAYAYQLWFDQIGATGVAAEIQIVDKATESFSFNKGRTFINKHLFQILPHSQAEIAAPLMTGEQKLISNDTYQLYRKAGIAHVLSVSGFHMALLATFLFFIIRSFCALFPRIVLYYNTKKIAAVFALIGTFLYLGLSGFQIPAVRAFVMISFVFLGILIERSVLSMRSVILIAMGLLLIKPQVLFSISFQLSFMAVIVLVALGQYIKNKEWPKIIKVSIGFLLLNIFVSLALTPFILYHFHQLMPYGIFGNMLFNGIFSFFIMPLLFVGALVMPLGLDTFFFRLAGWGVDVVRHIAEKLVNLPYAEISVSDFSVFSLSFFSLGIVLICWMKTPLKWVGILFIGMGAVLS